MSLTDLLAVAATLMAWWSLIPQIRKLLRTRDPSGVSSSWPAVGLVSNATWTAYLIEERLWAAAPSTAIMAVFYILVIWALRKAGRPVRRSLTAGALWAAALAAAGGVGGWDLVGLVLGVSYAVQFTPAVWTAFRSAVPRGISTQTWVVIGIEAILWGTYGWLNDNAPIVIYGVAGVAASALIIARYAVAAQSQTTGSSSSNRVSPSSRR